MVSTHKLDGESSENRKEMQNTSEAILGTVEGESRAISHVCRATLEWPNKDEIEELNDKWKTQLASDSKRSGPNLPVLGDWVAGGLWHVK